MQEAQTLTDETTTRRWTTHCPSCDSAVVVVGDRTARCPGCGKRVRPAGIETAAMKVRNEFPVDPNDSLVGQTLGR